MHEWALAEAVVEATASALETRNPACLRSVTVSVGELQAIDHEIFTFALNTLREQRPFRQAVYRLETEPARLRCGACGTEWGLSETAGLDSESREAIHFLPEAAHAFVRCPRCASPDFQVTAGRGVRIISITVDASGSCAEGPASP